MKRILIIDDDIDMCNLMSRFLQRRDLKRIWLIQVGKGL